MAALAPVSHYVFVAIYLQPFFMLRHKMARIINWLAMGNRPVCGTSPAIYNRAKDFCFLKGIFFKKVWL